MIIEKILGTNQEGKTVFLEKNSGQYMELAIPAFFEGTSFYQKENGEYVADTTDLSEVECKKLEQCSSFYYQTKHFLPYSMYRKVASLFPYSCSDNFAKNPYFLCDILEEDNETGLIPFPLVDAHIILGTFEDRKQELRYAIRYILTQNETEGHTWLPISDLERRTRKLLKQNGHPFQKGMILYYLLYFEDEFIIVDKYKVAFRATFEREERIYQKIRRGVKSPSPYMDFTYENQGALSEEQAKTVQNLIQKGGYISILTGGPGTGKTTTLKELVQTIHNYREEATVYLLAPTGKASKRIREVFEGLDVCVTTIHRFLGYGHRMTREERIQITQADFIIIDEFSMADLEIFDMLLNYVDTEKTKLILVGDVNQLPSIRPGNILADLIHLGVFTAKLSRNFRSENSLIAENAEQINEGSIFLKQDESFQIHIIPDYAMNFLAASQDSDVILTPYRQSGEEQKPASSECINLYVQQKRLRSGNTWSRKGGKYYVGDHIIMTHTNYKIGYFNGETGIITACLPGGEYTVFLGDRSITLRNDKDMTLGDAITTHKSQGSEYPDGIICIPKFTSFFTRRMLYTAVTRMKEKVHIFTSSLEDLYAVILNNQDEDRRTFLGSFPSLS